MIARVTHTITDHKKRFIPLAVALALLLGLFVSLAVTPNAQADYSMGCGYGYSSTGTFGYGTGNAFGYGYGTGGTFHFGYGDQVCPMFVTTTTLPSGTVGTAYPSTQLTATGGTNSYTWAVTSGALPNGLNLSTGGLITGTPTANGTFGFNATATDANGQPATRTLAITISPATTTTIAGGTTTTTIAGGTTTTTIAGGTTTTTTGGVTTTTVATSPPKRPSGCDLRGVIRSRKTTDVIITGHDFYAQPSIRSTDPGTRAIVRHDNGSRLIAVVQVRGFGNVGRLFSLTIRNADGFSCHIGYRLH